MADLLEQLTQDDLQGENLALAEVIGIDAFKNLIRYYGGTGKLYIPTVDKVVLPIRDELIRREYDGTNVYELARKWELTDRWIYEIVKEKVREMRARPVDGQLSLFGESG